MMNDVIGFVVEHTTVRTDEYTAESRGKYCPNCGHFGVYCISRKDSTTGTFFFWCPRCMECPYDLRTSQPTPYTQQVVQAMTDKHRAATRDQE